MTRANVIVVVLCFLILPACEDSGTAPAYFRSGTFDHSAFDTRGVPVASGLLTISRNGSKITGSWGFHDGSYGELMGRMEKVSIELELYHGFADHNLVLQGRLTACNYTGPWTRYGWAFLGRGSFTATLR